MKAFFIVCVVVLLLAVFVMPSCAAQDENHWSMFNEGSWVLYGLQGGMQQRQTLMAKTDTEITLKTEVIINGNSLSAIDTKTPLGLSASTESPDVKEYAGSAQAKGREISCTVFEMRTPQGISKTWISKEIPGGVAKTTVNDSLLLEVIDYETK